MNLGTKETSKRVERLPTADDVAATDAELYEVNPAEYDRRQDMRDAAAKRKAKRKGGFLSSMEGTLALSMCAQLAVTVGGLFRPRQAAPIGGPGPKAEGRTEFQAMCDRMAAEREAAVESHLAEVRQRPSYIKRTQAAAKLSKEVTAVKAYIRRRFDDDGKRKQGPHPQAKFIRPAVLAYVNSLNAEDARTIEAMPLDKLRAELGRPASDGKSWLSRGIMRAAEGVPKVPTAEPFPPPVAEEGEQPTTPTEEGQSPTVADLSDLDADELHAAADDDVHPEFGKI